MANPSGKADNLTNAGKGRKKGSKNKFTTLKQSFLDAFEDMGGVEGLAEWGKQEKNRLAFYQMVSKMLPKEVAISGPDGGPIEVKSIEVRFVKPESTD